MRPTACCRPHRRSPRVPHDAPVVRGGNTRCAGIGRSWKGGPAAATSRPGAERNMRVSIAGEAGHARRGQPGLGGGASAARRGARRADREPADRLRARHRLVRGPARRPAAAPARRPDPAGRRPGPGHRGGGHRAPALRPAAPRLSRLDRVDRAADGAGRGVPRARRLPGRARHPRRPVTSSTTPGRRWRRPTWPPRPTAAPATTWPASSPTSSPSATPPAATGSPAPSPKPPDTPSPAPSQAYAARSLASDGAALLVTDYRLLDWRGYLDLGYRDGPAGIIAATRTAERADPDRTRWPRQKVSDDATAAVCVFDTTREEALP